MGIICGYENCGFTAYDSDELISEKLWGVVKGIIDTCIENKQNIILEGCYLPPEKVAHISNDDVIVSYIIFSESYIEENFNKIIDYENIIKKEITRRKKCKSIY